MKQANSWNAVVVVDIGESNHHVMNNVNDARSKLEKSIFEEVFATGTSVCFGKTVGSAILITRADNYIE